MPSSAAGPTLIAAEQTGRRCCGLELDPRYVETIIRRWQTYSGEQAKHAISGENFDEIILKSEAQHVH